MRIRKKSNPIKESHKPSGKNREKILTNKPLRLIPCKKKDLLDCTLLLPVLKLLLLIEISLRIFNYGGNLDLFINGPQGYENIYELILMVQDVIFTRNQMFPLHQFNYS